MSRWRLAVRALYEIGGSANTFAIADQVVDSTKSVLRGLEIARHIGLVRSIGRHGSRPADWGLTQLGLDYCEGRVKAVTHDRSGTRPFIDSRMRLPQFVATWLASLPRDIKLEREAP